MTSKTIITCDACGEPIAGPYFVLAPANTNLAAAMAVIISTQKDLHPGCLGVYGRKHNAAPELGRT